MAFRPLPPRERLYTWLAALVLFLLALALLAQTLRTPPGPGVVWLAGLLLAMSAGLAVLLYRIWALARLDYWVERDAVRIFWSGSVTVVPLHEIRRIDRSTIGVAAPPAWWRWPAIWVRPARPGEPVVMLATRPPHECLALITARTIYILSPREDDRFIEAIQAHQALGPARVLDADLIHPPGRRHWLLQDRVAQVLVGAGLLLGLVFAASLVWRYPLLPAQLPLHFDAAGLPDRIGPRSAVFLLPGITLLIWFTNAVFGAVLYERQRTAAYILWGSALILQIAGFLVAQSLLALYLT